MICSHPSIVQRQSTCFRTDRNSSDSRWPKPVPYFCFVLPNMGCVIVQIPRAQVSPPRLRSVKTLKSLYRFQLKKWASKMEKSVLYEISSLGASRPFYYNPASQESFWELPSGSFRVSRPPDGFFAVPPPLDFHFPRRVEPKKPDISDDLPPRRTEKRATLNFHNIPRMPIRPVSTAFQGRITDNPEPLHNEFFFSPLLPFSLCETRPLSDFVAFLRDNTSEQKITRKEKMSFDDIISPGKKILSRPLLSITSSSAKGAAVNVFKNIRKWIDSRDTHAIGSIISLVDKDQSNLLGECVAQAITEANSNAKRSGNIDMTRAWELLMILTARYDFDDTWKQRLTSFFVTAAGSDRVEPTIRSMSLICLFRLCAEEPFKLTWEPSKSGAGLVGYVEGCTSMTKLFGVTLEEALEKEKARGITGSDSGKLVPVILEKIIAKAVGLGAANVEGPLRIPGSTDDRKKAAQMIDSGLWRVDVTFVHTALSLFLEFIRSLQDPLLPTSLVEKINLALESHECIAMVEALPNARRDTLMYVIGFLKTLAQNEAVTKMTISNITRSMGLALVSTRVPADLDMMNRIYYFIGCLIASWNTSDVFTG